MTLLTNAVPLLWLIASAGTFFLVFRPQPNWRIVATPIRALSVFVLVFIGGAMLTAVTRPDDATPPAPKPAVVANLPDPALVRAHPERYLRLDRVRVDRGEAVGGKPGAVLLSGGLINVSGLPLRDPRLTCRLLLLRGDVVEGTVAKTIDQAVPPGGKLIFAAIDMGRVEAAWTRWDCAVAEASAG